MVQSNRTEQFEITVGLLPGYKPENAMDRDGAVGRVVRLWQHLMEQETAKSGVIVSAIVSAGVAVYSSLHGCPPFGETVAVVRGVCNPEYNSDTACWRAAVVRLCEALQAELLQQTLYLTFTEVDFWYFTR